MSCNLILDRLVKIPWQAWPIFGPQQLWPVQANYCRPNVSAFPCQALPVLTLASRGLSRPCRPFMLFAFLSQFWPRPTAARPGRAGPVAAASPVFFIAARLTPAFRLGFDPSLPQSGRVPDAREMLCRDRWSGRHCSRATWVFYLACLHLHIP